MPNGALMTSTKSGPTI